MPLTEIHEADGEFSWTCRACGHAHRHRIDPKAGDIRLLTREQLVAIGNTSHAVLTIGPCEACAAKGKQVVESVRLDIPPWETGTHYHPSSLVGTQLPGGNVVIEHHVAGEIESGLTEEHREQARLIRALQQHPHLAPHAPLRSHKARRKGDPPGADLVDA